MPSSSSKPPTAASASPKPTLKRYGYRGRVWTVDTAKRPPELEDVAPPLTEAPHRRTVKLARQLPTLPRHLQPDANVLVRQAAALLACVRVRRDVGAPSG